MCAMSSTRLALITIRRIVDDDPQTFSLVRLLRAIDKLNTRDIHGVFFVSDEIQDDIKQIKHMSGQATNLVNSLIAHRTRDLPGGRLVPSIVPEPTYQDLYNVIDALHDVAIKYARRFYASGLPERRRS
jgi:HEPN superfamily AbiU2-like protein